MTCLNFSLLWEACYFFPLNDWLATAGIMYARQHSRSMADCTDNSALGIHLCCQFVQIAGLWEVVGSPKSASSKENAILHDTSFMLGASIVKHSLHKLDMHTTSSTSAAHRKTDHAIAVEHTH